MLKKTIKYEDFDGILREEDFYFNLTKSELTEWQLSQDGGLDNMLQRIVKEKRVPEIIKYIKEFILKAYGEKSEDGKRFMKSEEISHNFYCSAAYNELFMDVVASPESAMTFINGLLPEDVRKQIAEQQANAAQVETPNAEN